eukprot:1985306-Pyramimonas_sp.AAC.2
MLMQGKSIASRRKENMRRAYSNSSLPEPTYPGGGVYAVYARGQGVQNAQGMIIRCYGGLWTP